MTIVFLAIHLSPGYSRESTPVISARLYNAFAPSYKKQTRSPLSLRSRASSCSCIQ